MVSLSRRHLLQLGAGASLTLLASCRSGRRPPKLLAARGTLPKAWLGQLPSPWESVPAQDTSLWADQGDQPIDLVAMGDGWLSSVAPSRLQGLKAPALQQQLGDQAQRFLMQLGPERASQVLPVGVSPWVMLFRNGSAWLQAAQLSWEVLMDPALTGRVVLPASPRFVIDLADRIGGPSVLKRLRAQLLTMDDRQATSWLLKGRLGWWCCRCSGAWPCCDRTPAFGLCFPPLALRCTGRCWCVRKGRPSRSPKLGLNRPGSLRWPLNCCGMAGDLPLN